jgi:hypothetical protein
LPTSPPHAPIHCHRRFHKPPPRRFTPTIPHTHKSNNLHILELIPDNMNKDHDEKLAEEPANNGDEHTLTSPNDASVLQSTSSPRTRPRHTRKAIH